MITDVCLACGRPIIAVHRPGPPITLNLSWTHGGLGLRDLTHHPIPSSPDHQARTKINSRPLFGKDSRP